MAQWHVNSTAFDIAETNPIFDEWFQAKTIVAVDPVLGGIVGGNVRYVHVGGVDIQPLSFVMQWKGSGAVAARTTVKGYRGTVVTLSDDDGRSCQALLADCVDIRVKSTTSGYVRLGVTFIYVSE